MKYFLLLTTLFFACKSNNPAEPSSEPEVQVQTSSPAVVSSTTQNTSTPVGVSQAVSSEEAASSASQTTGTQVLKEGIFKATDVKTSGGYKIESRADGLYLVLGSDFKSSAGPDLFLVISKLPNSSFTNTNYSSISSNDKIVLGDILQGTFAGQERKIPVSAEEIGSYKTILFQCVKYSHTFGIAEIK